MHYIFHLHLRNDRTWTGEYCALPLKTQTRESHSFAAPIHFSPPPSSPVLYINMHTYVRMYILCDDL